jgi:signal peptidase I
MKPTILEGDRVFVNKLAYDLKVPFTGVHLAEWSAPARGDVVVFYSPADGQRLIKRVIGLPGDRLQMVGNQIYINGESVEHAGDVSLVSTDYLRENPSGPSLFRERLGDHMHPIAVQSWVYATRDVPEMTVPPGRYFMMGDNRDDSLDSRWFGLVDRNLIVGKAVAIALSVNPNAQYRPRWQRFLSPLP